MVPITNRYESNEYRRVTSSREYRGPTEYRYSVPSNDQRGYGLLAVCALRLVLHCSLIRQLHTARRVGLAPITAVVINAH